LTSLINISDITVQGTF